MANILVIEDDKLLQKSYRRMLRDHNLNVVDSGLEAMQLLERGKFDLVISDGDLRGSLSGIDVWKWVSNHRTDLLPKFIFCSGSMEVEKFCEKGNILFNDKTDPLALVERVNSLLEARS